MSAFTSIPVSALDKLDRLAAMGVLRDGAVGIARTKRVYVTAWAICDRKGYVPNALFERALAVWPEAMIDAEERASLIEILRDLELLGFVRRIERKNSEVLRFKRSSAWTRLSSLVTQ